MAFSFLNRKKDQIDLGNPIANTLYDYQQQQMSSALQSKQPTSSTQTNTKTSSQPIQGSGYSSQYASNPSNYQVQPAQIQPAPKPQPQNANSFVNSYLTNRGNIAQQRVQDTERRALEQQNLQKQLMQSRQGTLENIGNLQRQGFEDYANQLRSGLDLQRNTADRQIASSQAERDEQRYFNEQARRERMKGLEGTLASLGTLESSALGNIGAKINMGAERQDRQADRIFNDRVADIQDQYRAAEQQTNALIEQQANVYLQQVEALRGSMDENSIAYQQAVSQIAERANSNINAILDNFDNFAYQATLAAQQARLEAQGGLSDTFLTTGQPQNRADYQWMMENPDYLDKLRGQQQQENEAADAVRTIDEILQGNLAPITGDLRLGGIPGFGRAEAQTTKAKIENIKNNLSLAAAGKLKGSGQISDAEREMLARAATALDYGMTEEAFRRELNRLRGIFAKMAGAAAQEQQSDPMAINQSLVRQFGG